MRTVIPVTAVLLAVFFVSPSHATRDGRRFDPAATMTERAQRAPEELDKAKFMLGQWDVDYEIWADDSLAAQTTGYAEVTYMNRGHGYLERFHSPEVDGTELNTIMFLVYNSNANTWVMGSANSQTENISMANGNFASNDLVLHNVLRRQGGATMTFYRTTVSPKGDEQFDVQLDTSADMGKSWSKSVRRSYKRRDPSLDFMTPQNDFGEPAAGMPDEARQFDFLIGKWNEIHKMTLANGQDVEFPSNGTAVHCLNGHAILEYAWYDVDPQVPDQATSIVRIYNRQMRRWECMYSTNRFNSILYFGGAMEGDRIVLHMFDANTMDTPMSQWIFHDWQKGSYKWHANTSRDGGKEWNKTWIIEASRKDQK